ncbi:hypothetical protein GCM10023147_20760 [Tsukamurella soli]|uniref:Small CPxCG-related zinc finger protein n=1 Tax=Tsukamurella soli TaxID=644556 RepID=A0ABP8JJM5_9ACTN
MKRLVCDRCGDDIPVPGGGVTLTRRLHVGMSSEEIFGPAEGGYRVDLCENCFHEHAEFMEGGSDGP